MLFLPSYLILCPYNVFDMATEFEIPVRYGVFLIFWVVLQVGVMRMRMITA